MLIWLLVDVHLLLPLLLDLLLFDLLLLDLLLFDLLLLDPLLLLESLLLEELIDLLSHLRRKRSRSLHAHGRFHGLRGDDELRDLAPVHDI